MTHLKRQIHLSCYGAHAAYCGIKLIRETGQICKTTETKQQIMRFLLVMSILLCEGLRGPAVSKIKTVDRP